MKIRRGIVSLVAIVWVVAGNACTTDDPDIAWGPGLETGIYPVGFRTLEITRDATDGSSRSLTLSIWYPAAPNDRGSRVTLEDLFRIVLDEGQLTETDDLSIEPALAAAMTGVSTSLSIDQSRTVLDAPTLARRDAAPAEGRFPLALWSVRHATALAQAPLAEVLASHGSVVATVWSSDPPLAFVWEDRPEADKLATIEAHTRDLQYALGVLQADPTVDGERVVILSWSYGGQTAARLQEREPAVRAVVGLDANVLPAPEEQVEYRRPLLYIVGQDTTRRRFEELSQLGVPWLAVRLPELAHGNFNALEGYLPGLYEADTVFAWSRGGEVARVGYRVLVQIVTDAVMTFGSESAVRLSGLGERLRSHADSLGVEIRSSRR